MLWINILIESTHKGVALLPRGNKRTIALMMSLCLLMTHLKPPLSNSENNPTWFNSTSWADTTILNGCLLPRCMKDHTVSSLVTIQHKHIYQISQLKASTPSPSDASLTFSWRYFELVKWKQNKYLRSIWTMYFQSSHEQTVNPPIQSVSWSISCAVTCIDQVCSSHSFNYCQ